MKSKTQYFLENALNTSLSAAKVLLQSKRTRLPHAPKPTCVILANGPSLNESLQTNPDFFKDRALLCVNDFANTEYYAQYQPQYYVLNAVEYWTDNFAGLEKHIVKRNKLFANIKKQTHWDLTIFTPHQALASKTWQGLFDDKPNIKIVPYNVTPVEGFTFFNHFSFKRNLGMPRPHNVLLPSLMITINMQFREIYLLGADHSWLPLIRVDDNNRSLVDRVHFYDKETSKATPMYKPSGYRKLHEVLTKFVYTFEGYFILKNYAATRGVTIYNATPGSYIDAFDRVDIGKL